jgi:hypothetical protein
MHRTSKFINGTGLRKFAGFNVTAAADYDGPGIPDRRFHDGML